MQTQYDADNHGLLLEISLKKDTNYQHLTASAYIGLCLCLCLCACGNQPLFYNLGPSCVNKEISLGEYVNFNDVLKISVNSPLSI